MPNHVINEVIFRNVTPQQRQSILAKVSSDKSPIDFAVLLPIPLNYWQGSVGIRHEKTFPGNALEWCSANWSTKWNAYGINGGGRYQSVAETDDALTLTFRTAWGPPMGWLCALFNTFQIPFTYRWLSEGGEKPKEGNFAAFDDNNLFQDPWTEGDADEATGRHLHMLLWGVEEFDDEPTP